MSRLKSDRQIAPLVAQFVPLKIETNGPQWQQWASRYRPEGNAIPIVYIVRADGEMLYGKSGALQGNALPQLLVYSLRTAGRTFSRKELTTLIEAVKNSEKAKAEGDVFGAVKAISVVKKFGTPGKLNSHAKAAIKADQIVHQMGEDAKKALAEAEQKLADPEKQFEGALTLVQVKKNYSLLPSFKTELTKAARKYEKDDSLSDVLTQADMLDRARRQARVKLAKKKALDGFQRIIERYPDSPAAQLARAEYQALAGEAPSESEQASGDKPAGDKLAGQSIRLWTDSTGKYRIKAKLVELGVDFVVLEKEDGKLSRVPLAKLSERDQRYCQALIDKELELK